VPNITVSGLKSLEKKRDCLTLFPNIIENVQGTAWQVHKRSLAAKQGSTVPVVGQRKGT